MQCQCDCGNLGIFTLAKLRHGWTRSCGCLKVEKSTKHGISKRYDLPEWKVYSAWNDMKNRCGNPKVKSYADYGGRGIKVHPLWKGDFAAFFADVGMPPSKSHSLGRIDNDGDYEPGNVKWQTAAVQMRNTRRTRFLEFQGETKPLTDWAHAVGIKPILLTTRLRAGWSIERALTEPIHETGKRCRNAKDS